MSYARSHEKQRGMMLLEGLIAIVIFSLGILAIVGLQSASVRHTTDAKYRMDASFLANQSIGLMWTKRSDLDSFKVTNEDVTSLPNGKRTIDVNGKDVTVTVTWQLPGEPAAHSYAIAARIN
ncbi:hypothetical protein [Noviherbaspirillum sp.]|uniref:type IV pilus modification PilV family protein n=1 Tax=Noviherbaspirillum sp. TaxID=1926288 RepID=UPI0025EAA26E|nr:hypothetical protein [Noviherbaspirillum sp.]